MKGKNIEKLVLFNRIAIVSIIVAALVFGTISHTSNQNTNSRGNLDSMLANADFNTVDFSPVVNPEVPVVGDNTDNSDDASNADAEAAQKAELDQLLAGLISGSSDVQDLRAALLQRRNSKAASEEPAEQSPQTSPSYTGYHYQDNSPHAHTTSTTSTATNSSTSQPSQTPRRKTNYDDVVYVDDNYENIDSSTDPGDIPGGEPNSSSEDPAQAE